MNDNTSDLFILMHESRKTWNVIPSEDYPGIKPNI